MSTAVRKASSIIEVRVSDDRLEAVLMFGPGARLTPPTSADANKVLSEARIPVDRDAMARIKEALSECRKGNLPRGGILLRRGTAPGESKDEELAWAVEPDEGSRETPLPLRRVRKGDPVASITPAVEGQCGLNVHGNAIAADKPKKLNLVVGDGLTSNPDRSIEATIDGIAIQQGLSIRVAPLAEIDAKAIDAAKGVEVPGVLLIHGQPPEGVLLQAASGMVIDGSLGATLLTCGGPLVVTEGIEGQTRERTYIDVDGDFLAPHVFDARFNITGTAGVTNEIHNVTGRIGSKLDASDAVFSGGEITVAGDANIGVLGSVGDDDTSLAVGVDQKLKQQYQRLSRIMEQLNESIGKIEQACFLANTRNANESAKERVCQWEMARDDLGQLKASTQNRLSEIGRSMLEFIEARLEVQEAIHPGCTVIVAGIPGEISAPWSGPLAVTRQIISGRHALVVESKSGRRMVIR